MSRVPIVFVCMRCELVIISRYSYLWAADSTNEALTLRLCSPCWIDLAGPDVSRRLHAEARNSAANRLL